MLQRRSEKPELSYTLHALEIEPTTTDSSHSPVINPGVPVICFHGSGNYDHSETWLPLVREMTRFTTVLYYERRGSTQRARENPRRQTPREAVRDLEALLRRIPLRPPYVLLAHSYGGTVAREFLLRHPAQVAGMVLAETGQETPTDHDEAQCRRQALGRKPLSVVHADSLRGVRDASAVSAEGRRLRRLWAAEDERLKRAQLRLSANARYVRVEDCGHNVVRDRPDVVAEELRWVLGNIVLSGQQSTRALQVPRNLARRVLSGLLWRKNT